MDAVTLADTVGATMALAGVAVVDAVTVADIVLMYVTGVAHADWTLRDGAVNGWSVQTGAVYAWAT
jgi:hypothetical protein